MDSNEVGKAHEAFVTRLNRYSSFPLARVMFQSDPLKYAVISSIQRINVVVEDLDEVTYAAHNVQGGEGHDDAQIVAATADLLITIPLQEGMPAARVVPIASVQELDIVSVQDPWDTAEWPGQVEYRAKFPDGTVLAFPFGQYLTPQGWTETRDLLRRFVTILSNKSR